MIRTITILILLINCRNIHAQTPKDSIYNVNYNKLKRLYIKSLDTELSKKANAMTKAYVAKWRYAYDGLPADLGKDKGGLNWLKNNWRKTKFTSYEVAEKEYNDVLQAHLDADSEPEGKAFNDFYIECVLQYGAQIYIDMYFDVKSTYPDKF